MKQVAPQTAFPSGDSWIAGVLSMTPAELTAKFGIVFEDGTGDLGRYRLAALEDPCVGQVWLLHYDSAPYGGTEVLVDVGVLRDDALFAIWDQLGIDIRGFEWVNHYQRYPDHNGSVDGGAQPPAAGFPGLWALTPREREVLELLAEGSTNTEIGSQLSVSRPTVTTHLRNIASKLGMGTVRRLRETATRYPHLARTA